MTTITATPSTDDAVIVESLAGIGATVQAAENVIRGVKLIGFESLNGRSYPPPVLRAAVSLYEGVMVNVDHPLSGNPNDQRRLADRIGVIKNARFVEGRGIYGDFHYNPKHRLAEQVAYDAANSPASIGFSHNARLRMGATVNGKRVVDSIEAVRSVDLVADPATTSSLFESFQEPHKTKGHSMTLAELTLEQLEQARPDLVTALQGRSASQQASAQASAQNAAALEAVQAELAAAKKLLARQALEATICAELEAAGLDRANKQHVSDVFAKQLLACESTESIRDFVNDRAALLKIVGQKNASLPSKPTTSTGAGAGGNMVESIDPATFARRFASK